MSSYILNTSDIHDDVKVVIKQEEEDVKPSIEVPWSPPVDVGIKQEQDKEEEDEEEEEEEEGEGGEQEEQDESKDEIAREPSDERKTNALLDTLGLTDAGILHWFCSELLAHGWIPSDRQDELYVFCGDKLKEYRAEIDKEHNLTGAGVWEAKSSSNSDERHDDESTDWDAYELENAEIKEEDG